MKEESEVKVLHRNIPQLLINAILARIMLLLWARGTGKTEGGTGVWTLHNVKEMPGSVGAVGTDSYKHLRKQILPEIEKTWRKLGLVKGKDYWIDTFPPKALGVPEAIRPISEPENTIFFRNGSAIKLFSFNFQSLQQGDSIDYLAVEETKLVNPKRLNEVFPCLRGNEDAEWAWKSCHKSILLVTDMPEDIEGQWILDYADQVDEKLNSLILKIQAHISLLEDKLEQGAFDKKEQKEVNLVLEELRIKVNEFRKKAVFVSYASTLENLHALGLDVIKNLQKVLNDLKFRRSVMNELPQKAKDCFYHFLSKERHGYVALNEKYLRSLKDKDNDDCRWDSDVVNDTLYLSFDYNGNFCSAIAAQFDEKTKQLKFIKNFYADLAELKSAKEEKGLRLLRFLCRKIVTYYKYRINRSITYFYDNTAIGTDADRDTSGTYKSIVEKELDRGGFKVESKRVDQSTHKERFDCWEKILSNDEDASFSFTFNKENCNEWFFASTNTKTVFKKFYSKDGELNVKFEKDKSSEKKGNIHPVQSTHLTEAGDVMLMAFEQKQNKRTMFVG